MKTGFVVFALAGTLLATCARCLDLTFLGPSIRDGVVCYTSDEPSKCLEERTTRLLRDLNAELRMDWPEREVAKRAGKSVGSDEETKALQESNERLLERIERRGRTEARGLLDEVTDFLSYITFKLLSPFTGGGVSDDSVEEEDDGEEKQLAEGRGKKKKELKKKNKQLKLILLLMLFKNKIKMFVNKLQFLVQLKFLGVATINMLANVFRLWLELKKKHKPNKVVFYENAHHQHHYDHEHFDSDDSHFSRPGFAHFGSHYDYDDDHGGGPWPWSRVYSDKPRDERFRKSSPQRSSVMYYNKRQLS